MKVLHRRSLLAVALLALCPCVPLGAAPVLPDLAADEAVGRFQGVIGAVDRGDPAPVWRSVGQAHSGVPHSEQVAYPVASVAKTFTAVAVFALVEQGKLSLEDRLDAHYPRARGRPAGAVTIAQLLQHSSGIPSVMQSAQGVTSSLDETQWPYPVATSVVLEEVLAMPLRFEPGSRYEYNNSAYLLLGEVVSAHVGKPAGEAVVSLALGSVGLADQACFCDAVPGRANALPRELSADGTLIPAIPTHHTRAGTAGGLRITPAALLQWGKALVDGRILRPDTLQQMWADGLPTRTEGTTMGMGWSVRSKEGLVMHDGALPGSVASLVINRDTGRVSVGVLSPTLGVDHLNRSEDYLEAHTLAVARGELAGVVPELADTRALDMAGTYRLADGRQLQVSRAGDGWQVHIPQGSPLLLPLMVHLSTPEAQRSRALVDAWMAQGQGVILAAMSDNLRKGLPPDALTQLADSWTQAHGTYMGNHAFRQSSSGRTVHMRLQFARGTVDFGLMFDTDGKLDGLMMLDSPRDDLPSSVAAWSTESGQIWVDGYRYGTDPVILRPRVQNGQVSGLWIGSRDMDGAFVPRQAIESGER